MADPDDSDLIEHALGVRSSSDGDDAASQATMPSLPRHVEDLSGRMLGEFILRKRIGEGSFGVAYRCEQPLLGREAVVKVLRERLARGGMERFVREAQLASRLGHPYAAHVYAFGVEVDDDIAWIAMELVQGDTLSEWLRRRGPMPLEQFVPFFERVAEVVQAAHDAGIVHRDLKPSNMMVVLDRAGQLYPKLLDFGIAKLIDVSLASTWPTGTLTGEPQSKTASAPASDASEARPATSRVGAPLVRPPRNEKTIRQLTRPSVAVGTPEYMAPEQARATYPVGPRSDLYSLGIIAYEALTGHRPFRAETAAEYAELHHSAPIPPLGGAFPPALDRLFQRALAKHPENRWGNALEFAAALKVAANLGSSPVNLPRIDGIVRAEWIADAPQPLAESIAALDGARNAHEARERVQEIVQHLLRYLTAVALATWSAAENDDQALLELVRALDRRELTTHERLRLLRLLARSRDGHPIPELGELLTCDPDGDDALAPIPALYAFTKHSGTEDSVLTRLRHLIPRLAELLSRTRFILDYVLVVPVGDALERWTGLRQQPRVAELLTAGTMVEGHPMLLDRNGALCADLWPLVQVSTPPEGGDAEMFLFDGRGGQGAQMIAAPRSLVRDDVEAWRWISSRLVEDVKAKARMREQVGTAARQWHDRGRPSELLWRGTVLAEFESWRVRTSPQLDEIEAAFAKASQEREQKERDDAEARRRRTSRIRRWLAAGVAVAAVAVIQYRAYLKAEMKQEVAEQGLTQAEVEQGRQALLHNESNEAITHLASAYQRGSRSPDLLFMLARALESRLATRAVLHSGEGRMWSSVFSPDARRVVTSDDRGARVWDAASGDLQMELAHGGIVRQASWAPDGSRIATAGEDGAIKLWDAASGTMQHELRSRGGNLRYFAIAFSTSTDAVAAVDSRGLLAHIWNINTGEMIREVTGDGTGWAAIAYSADGRYLAISGGGEVRVFDTTTWKSATTVAQVAPSSGAHISSLAFDPTGPRLLTATSSGDATIWALPSGDRLFHLRETGEAIGAAAFSPDGRLIVTGADDGAEQVWSAENGKLVSQLNQHRGKIHSIEFDASSQLVLASGANGSVVISDAMQGVATSLLEGPASAVRVAHFDRTSSLVVGASWDGTARIWDAHPVHRRWGVGPLGPNCGSFDTIDPDHRFLAVSCVGHGTRVVDTAQDRILAELPAVTELAGEYYSALPSVSADGEFAAIAQGTDVAIYALPDRKLVRRVAHQAAVNAVAFAPAGHDVVSGSTDGTLLLTHDGGEPVVLRRGGAGIDSAAILADGRVIATDTDRKLRVYRGGVQVAELESPTRIRSLRPSSDGHRLLTIPIRATAVAPVLFDLDGYRFAAKLEGHRGRVISARFAAGRIVTAGVDGSARLWDAETGRLVHVFAGTSLADATLSPDGAVLVTGSADGQLRFWDVSTSRALWTMQAYRSYVAGIRFDAGDIITRGFGGEVTRWDVRRPMPAELLDTLARCLPAEPGDAARQPCDGARLRLAEIIAPTALSPGTMQK